VFSKILIANRGEIACRVIRTARRMGIRSVAVYSEADSGALHVRMADESVAIGPARATDSYLNIDAILAAAQKTGAEAVHPGYGFLSENPLFVEALGAAGLAFIGPPAKAIAAMGDKLEAKRLAEAAGVSIVPGHGQALGSSDEAARIAHRLGYPVMLKAAAGGGGKGMRLVRAEAELKDSLRAAASEARSSFGDDRVMIEKAIRHPRHIEVQVLADQHGNAIHLGERECSIQRRHQKVIEEAPSPLIDKKTRAAMGAQAVALIKAVGYASAGTVEFIVDEVPNFYFMEMNTRLQVEHPVTELVTGIDLVEEMIRIAAGERLRLAQKDVRLSGVAIEARVYAEDPSREFLPSTGRLVRYREPEPSERVRVDSGVREGDQVSVYYDPMLAKVIARGKDRAEAIATLGAALDSFIVRGVAHNIRFLSAVVRHPRFAAGRISTDFIAEAFPDGFLGAELAPESLVRLLASAAFIHRRVAERDLTIGGRMPSIPTGPASDWVVRVDGVDHAVSAAPAGEGYAVVIDGAAHRVEGAWRPGDLLFRGKVDGDPLAVEVERVGPGWRLAHGGAERRLLVLSPRAAELARLMPEKAPPDLSRFLLSPMPGLLVSMAVTPGQEVRAGEELAIVEAMKMENVLRAERDGRVRAIHAAPGDSLAVDQAILEFE